MRSQNLTNIAGPLSPGISDYIEITVLACMIACGIPLNCIALIRLIRRQQGEYCRQNSGCRNLLATAPSFKGSRQRSQLHHLTVLKMHLVVANILMLCVYCIGELVWLSTYQFLGADWMCRLVAYLYAFCFYANSNLVAALALYRLYVFRNVDKPRGSVPRKLDTWMNASPWLAWILAAANAAPQVLWWKIFQPDVVHWPQWKDCSSIWNIEKAISGTSSPRYSDAVYYERLYIAFHLISMFWIPVSVIAGSYAMMSCAFKRSIHRVSSVGRGSLNTGNDGRRSVRRLASAVMPLSLAAINSVEAIQSSDQSLGSLDDYHETELPEVNAPKNSISTMGKRVMDTVVMMDTSGVGSTQLAVPSPQHSRQAVQNNAVARLTRAKRQTMRTSALMLLLYAAFWAPYNLLSMWQYLFPEFNSSYFAVLEHLVALNAVVNPLVFCRY